MKDELHKPLGLKPETPARSGVSARIALSLALLAAGAGGGWYLAADRFQAPPPAEPAPAVAEQQPAPAGPAPADDGEAEPAVTETADSGEGLQEVEPTGNIEPKIPVPEMRRQEAGLAHLPDPALIEKSPHGMIPKRGPQGQRPMDVYSRPPATEGNFGVARVVIVVGGMGISQTSSQLAVQRLPPAVTLAFAPYGNSLARWMQQARKRGFELLVQVPMEPFDYPANSPGEHTLRVEAAAEEQLSDLHWAMSRVSNYVGVMNFLGGRFMADRAALKPVFDDLAQRGLLFVDDGTVRNSAAPASAAAAALPHARAGIQLDSIRTRKEIAARLEELAAEAKRTGLAIGVANAFPESIEMIAAFAEGAGAKGIEITPVSAIVKDPERKAE